MRGGCWGGGSCCGKERRTKAKLKIEDLEMEELNNNSSNNQVSDFTLSLIMKFKLWQGNMINVGELYVKTFLIGHKTLCFR